MSSVTKNGIPLKIVKNFYVFLTKHTEEVNQAKGTINIEMTIML